VWARRFYPGRWFPPRFFPALGAEAAAEEEAGLPMYSSDKLVRLIRSLGAIPNTGAQGAEAADLLLLADDALRNYLLPDLLNLKEDYYVVRERFTLANNQTRVPVPPHAIFNKLREIYWVDGSDRRQLDPIPTEELQNYNGTGTKPPVGFILEGDDVQLVPTTGSYGGSLELVYFFRPGDLVLTANARKVTSVNPASKIVGFGSAVPVGWDNTDTFDIHSRHSGAKPKMWDQPAVTVSGTQITFTNAIDGSIFGSKAIEIGDWVCLAGEAAIVGLPAEYQGLLAHAVGLIFAESIGDTAQAQLHGQILEKFLKKCEAAAERRTESKPIRLGGRGRGLLGNSRRVW